MSMSKASLPSVSVGWIFPCRYTIGLPEASASLGDVIRGFAMMTKGQIFLRSLKMKNQESEFHRPTQVLGLIGISHATLWRWQRDGLFPKRLRLGPGVVGFRKSEVFLPGLTPGIKPPYFFMLSATSTGLKAIAV